MEKIMLSCLKATELVEKKQLFKLSLVEKLKLSFHLKICKSCLEYEKQSLLIEKAIEKTSKIAVKSTKLNENKKEIIYKRLFK